SYDHLLVRSADAFGGAGGKGTYMTVNTSINKGSSPTTVTLATPQRYFGLWWSAGDPNNVLSFFSGSTLIETFRTSEHCRVIASGYLWTKQCAGDLFTSGTGSVKPAYLDAVASVAKSGRPECVSGTSFGSDRRATLISLSDLVFRCQYATV